MINAYHKEQADAIVMVRQHLFRGPETAREHLLAHISAYLDFRNRVDRFLSAHFAEICTASCFQSRVSACCSKEGIITFFADVVVNALISNRRELRLIETALERPNTGFKCVYLGENGCIWRVRPIVCAMFLCGRAENQVFSATSADGGLQAAWESLQQEKKAFTWPDRPVLFDFIEKHFIAAGYESPLMYLNNSPGMRRVKQKAGLLQSHAASPAF